MDLRDKLKALAKLGVSLAKLTEPLHRSTICKYMSGERNLSDENVAFVKDRLKIFKEEINNIL